jgi:hypothetical protein
MSVTVNAKTIQFEYISTEKMAANMLTKAISKEKHSWYMKIVGLGSFENKI